MARDPETAQLYAECLAHMRGEDPWRAEREAYQQRRAELDRKVARWLGQINAS